MAGARLGVDVGSVRIGVARCDAAHLLTVPVATLPQGDDSVAAVVALAHDYDADVVYVGHPLSLSGASTASTESAVEWARALAAATTAQVRLVDERLSTRTAQAHLHQAGRSTKASRAVIDQAAAIVLLEQAIDIERRTGSPAGVEVVT